MVSRARRARNLSCYLDRSLRIRAADTFKQECLGEIDGGKTKTNTRGTGQLAPRPLGPSSLFFYGPRRYDPTRVILLVTIEFGSSIFGFSETQFWSISVFPVVAIVIDFFILVGKPLS